MPSTENWQLTPAGAGDPELTIGELARLAGRPASTIRYYESVGVLPQAERVRGQRRYPPGTARRLAVIDTAQRAGLSLEEITELLGASPEDPVAVERLRRSGSSAR